MNIYLVSRTDEVDYDEYDAFIVAAKDEEQARNQHPRNNNNWCDNFGGHGWVSFRNKASLTVTVIGKASEEQYTKPTILLASFNAG